MEKEDYVTEDVARVLKEKGFTEKCRGYYYGGMFSISCFGNEYNKQNVDYCIDAPSLAQAAKWLREKHNISVEPYATASGWKWTNCKACKDVTGGTFIDSSNNHYDTNLMDDCGSFDTYEQALNEGIKEALIQI